MTEVRDVIIIGSGPAGYTAALYAARGRLNPLLFEGSVTSGGALMNTTEVENFPGFADGVLGPELMDNIRKQAERFGAELVPDDVTEVDLSATPKVVKVGEDTYLARTVINDGLTWWWAHRTIQWLDLSPRRVQRSSLRYVVHFGGLVGGERAEVAEMPVRRDEQVAGRVRELVQHHERSLTAMQEQLLLGLAEDAAVELVGVLDILQPPRRPQRLGAHSQRL